MKEPLIPDGVPKSGRFWKVKQTKRSSLKLSNVKSLMSWDAKEEVRKKKKQVQDLERGMIEERKKKIGDEKQKTVEKQQRRLQNEFKNAVYQMVCFLALSLHF